MSVLLRWAISVLALVVTVYAAQALGIKGFQVAPGSAGVIGVGIFVLALGIANAVLRPVVKMLTLPVTCLTFGLFSLVVNAFFFWLVGQFVPGFQVSGAVAPLFGSMVMGVVGGLLNNLLVSKRERKI